ncbi:AAA family ATPase [Gammaproteobacteria bacterium]|uniref:Chromosome partition protein Smc n=1 Tax=SAR86 cluster bacterium SAR86A TaxID=1123866 RepID=J4WUC1_9GAMM|nr:MAG: chain F, Smc Head Domain protein [SAR86 cluster bacterium SAR86A]MDC3161199.1 AAA family ATPase [Gammaproteobacteria bacterium]|tara:strand:+ start:228 stop:2426 length:2199 start_codon:yes stop_codon:yes gene_type:complete
MQLKHIKLSGFKSFVDPTKISFPTNMVGVVGPNGCGKSNVIDAIRWVLGELSAKNLRGESMVDVIFNGSEKRKASGQCSIELLFDNSSAKIGGEYASYNEVSIKRVMTRDAQSDYFINNAKCRRKDVQDIFLGTGLGPSSYAIIEQGMVSKLVSAKPDELRTHIEEAAGVSKYRERRRETESRIKRTKENLSRVKDIRDEIGRLIKRLENQAKAAEKYKKLNDEKSQIELDTAILFSLEAKNNRDDLQKKLDSLNRDLKIKNAESETIQSQIDQFRTENESVLTEYESAQKNFYSIGAEIAKREANLQNINKTENETKFKLEKTKENLEKAKETEKNFDELSPSEQAIHILNEIIATLKKYSIQNDSILDKANKLKVLLAEILNIASAQSKTLTEEYQSRQEDLSKEIFEAEKLKSSIEEEMQTYVEESSQAESVLISLRQKQSKFNEDLRSLENNKSIVELDSRSISEKITNIRLDLKTYEINLENSNKKIKAAGIDIEKIDFTKYEDLSISELEDKLADIEAKIIRLGAINLAAPEEIEEESKRKEELDKQYDDLIEALDKLNGAIKKIDNETKTIFKDSFDAVNIKLKEVFPKLFGGGLAELNLTDDDPLHAGVILMARPPGKKNSSISQLSGGEKALTALALVFAIFDLNPAPFCLLDEVDAPLDDLNTLRFINMVEEMSKTVQFIFITHNKVSMERSDYLMGVTMQEAGVSRMVSVDVNQALELAES